MYVGVPWQRACMWGCPGSVCACGGGALAACMCMCGGALAACMYMCGGGMAACLHVGVPWQRVCMWGCPGVHECINPHSPFSLAFSLALSLASLYFFFTTFCLYRSPSLSIIVSTAVWADSLFPDYSKQSGGGRGAVSWGAGQVGGAVSWGRSKFGGQAVGGQSLSWGGEAVGGQSAGWAGSWGGSQLGGQSAG